MNLYDLKKFFKVQGVNNASFLPSIQYSPVNKDTRGRSLGWNILKIDIKDDSNSMTFYVDNITSHVEFLLQLQEKWGLS